jgi:dihydrofolate reductase
LQATRKIRKRKPSAFGKVIWDVTMSLDGFIANPNHNPGKIFDWYFSGHTPSKYRTGNLDFRLSSEDAKYFDARVKKVGAIIAGRRTYDVSQAWEGSFFIPVPFFVLTHKCPKRVPQGTTKFTFVNNGIESAITQAKKAAGNRLVSIMGANVAKQCIERGLLDEIHVSIAPYLLGDGVRLFDYACAHLVKLKRTAALASSSGMTHLSFKVFSL